MYSKTDWQDRVVERPRTYIEEINQDGSKTLTPAPGEEYVPGTPLTAANFNKMEAGIADGHFATSVFMQFFLNFKRWLLSKVDQLGVMLRVDIQMTLDATQKENARASLGLGDAALRDVGTGEGNVPVLNSLGKIPDSLVSSYFMADKMADVTAKADLTTLTTAQKGDWTNVTGDADPGNDGAYSLGGDGDPTVLANWKPMYSPGEVRSVNGQTGAVALTAADVGAATAVQGTKADSALQPEDVVDNLISTDTDKPVSANMAKSLNDTKMAKTTSDAAIKKGDGSGGLANAVEGTDYVGVSAGKALPERISSPRGYYTDSITLDLTHAGKLLWMNNSANATITIPHNDTVAFPIETEIEILRYGAGAVTIVPASGVTIASVDTQRSVGARYATVALKKLDYTNLWLLTGYLS